MGDEEVNNNPFIDLNGTIFNIPVNKSIIVLMFIGFVALAMFLQIDVHSLRSILTNSVVAVTICGGTFQLTQMIYHNDHLSFLTAFNYFFKNVTRYEIDLDRLDDYVR